MLLSDPAEESTTGLSLKRANRVYRPGELVEGSVSVDAPRSWDYKKIKLNAKGLVTFSEKGESSVELLHEDVFVQHHGGAFPEGQTVIPFEFPVRGVEDTALLETYHGVYISICYRITLCIERGFLQKDIQSDVEFVVEVPQHAPPSSKLVSFVLSDELARSGEASKSFNADKDSVPVFKLRGSLHSSCTALESPMTGEIVLDRCDVPVESIECQLIRIETIRKQKTEQRHPTEIQNLQIVDGDISRGLVVPIYVVLPRLFSCPSMSTPRFCVEFALNIIVLLRGGLTCSDMLPLVLYRDYEASESGGSHRNQIAATEPGEESLI